MSRTAPLVLAAVLLVGAIVVAGLPWRADAAQGSANPCNDVVGNVKFLRDTFGNRIADIVVTDCAYPVNYTSFG